MFKIAHEDIRGRDVSRRPKGFIGRLLARWKRAARCDACGELAMSNPNCEECERERFEMQVW